MTSCVTPASSLQMSADLGDIEFVDVDGDEAMFFHQDKYPSQRSMQLRIFDDLGLDVSRRRTRSPYGECNFHRADQTKCLMDKWLLRCEPANDGGHRYEWRRINQKGCAQPTPPPPIACRARVKDLPLSFKENDIVCVYLEPDSQAKKCCRKCNRKGFWKLLKPKKFCRVRRQAATRQRSQSRNSASADLDDW